MIIHCFSYFKLCVFVFIIPKIISLNEISLHSHISHLLIALITSRLEINAEPGGNSPTH